jgi:hypothetical protein
MSYIVTCVIRDRIAARSFVPGEDEFCVYEHEADNAVVILAGY